MCQTVQIVRAEVMPLILSEIAPRSSLLETAKAPPHASFPFVLERTESRFESAAIGLSMDSARRILAL